MAHTIRNFQALSTRKFDVLPEASAKNIDRILTSLESKYDPVAMYTTLSAFQRHLTATGMNSHLNISWSPEVLHEKLAAALRERYNELAAVELSELEFDAIFEERPDFIMELLRRLRLIERGYVEPLGNLAGFYDVDRVNFETFGVGSHGIVIRAEEAMVVMQPALSGDQAHYRPLLSSEFPLPCSGNIILELGGLTVTPDEDRSLLILAGADFALRVFQTATGDAEFDIGLTIDDEEELITSVSLAGTETVRRLMVSYDKTGVSVSYLTADGTLSTDWLTVFELQTLRPTSLQIYPEMVPLAVSEGPADLLNVMVIGGRPEDDDALYYLTNPL